MRQTQAWHKIPIEEIKRIRECAAHLSIEKTNKTKGQMQTIAEPRKEIMLTFSIVDHHGSGTRFGKHNRNAWNCKQLSSGDIAQINMKMTWFIHAHSTLWHCVACWRGDVPRFILLTLNWTLKTTSEKCIQRIALFFKSFRWRESHVRWTEYSSLFAFMQWEFIAAPNHYAKLCDWIKKKFNQKWATHKFMSHFFFQSLRSFTNTISISIRGI